MQLFAATLKQSAIRQQSLLNISKRLAWQWVEEPTDNAVTGPEQRQQFKSRDILAKNSSQLDRKDSNSSRSTTNSSSNMVEMLRSELRAEIDAVKMDKTDLLQARNDELLARLETMEQKLKVAELEMKLVKQELHTLIAQKVTDEATGRQENEVDENVGKIADDDGIIKTELLVKMAKQLDDISLRGKVGNLESKAVKLEQMHKALVELDLTRFLWSNNKWHVYDQEGVQISVDGLNIIRKVNKNVKFTNVRAQQPTSQAMLALIPALKFVYWEVQMKKDHASRVGWVAPNFSLNDDYWIDDHPGSFGINYGGNCWESGDYVEGNAKEFDEGDVVGSGLLLTRDNRLKLFFTLNGALNGETIVLKNSQDLLFYPALSLFNIYSSLEANFGADPVGKPFKFDVDAHETELFC